LFDYRLFAARMVAQLGWNTLLLTFLLPYLKISRKLKQINQQVAKKKTVIKRKQKLTLIQDQTITTQSSISPALVSSHLVVALDLSSNINWMNLNGHQIFWFLQCKAWTVFDLFSTSIVPAFLMRSRQFYRYQPNIFAWITSKKLFHN